MLSAIRRDKTQTIAKHADKSLGPFFCPSCGDAVVLRKGTLKIPHFAHQTPDVCRFGAGESEEHRLAKTAIYEGLLKRSDVSNVVLERPLGEVRPDVSAVIRGVKVAIEMQLSVLPLETIIRRTEEYARRGIALLWLCPWTPRLDDFRYSASAQENWLHAAYYGQVYYWRSDLSVIPYHFEPYLMSVPTMEWRDKKGKLTTGGGYNRMSKRFRKAEAGKMLRLVEDFHHVERPSFQAGRFHIPKARLWMGKSR